MNVQPVAMVARNGRVVRPGESTHAQTASPECLEAGLEAGGGPRRVSRIQKSGPELGKNLGKKKRDNKSLKNWRVYLARLARKWGGRSLRAFRWAGVRDLE